MNVKILFLLVLFWNYDCFAADSKVISGIPSITDGDTLRIGDIRIRLLGIDAPETKQTCTDANGKIYHCGIVSTDALVNKIGGRSIDCRLNGKQSYNRELGTCYLKEDDLNKWMVRNGVAVAYRHYSTAYVADEDAAKAEKKGLWAGSFEMPWDFRRNKQQ